MTTISVNQWEINGVIDTNRNVVENLNDIAGAAGAFLSWDTGEGVWSVIINDVATPVMNFTEDSIVGSISVSGSGINELYNEVTIEFPHRDLRDQTDFIDLKIPQSDQFAQELPNRLNLRTDLVNDPIQAERMASRELKQSRLNTIIKFRSDFTANGLQAGDIFTVTADEYAFNSKAFRAIEIVEQDDDQGALFYEITGQEYDPDVYTTENLVREERSKQTGIVPKSQNTALTQSESEDAVSSQFSNLIAAIGIPAFLSLLNGVFGGTTQARATGIPMLTYGSQNFTTTEVQTAYNAIAGSPSNFASGFTGSTNYLQDGIIATINLQVPYKAVQITVTLPLSSFSYWRKVNGTEERIDNVTAFAPSQITVYQGASSATEIASYTADWQSNTITLILENTEPETYFLNIFPLLTYDLDQEDRIQLYPFNHAIQPNSSGAGITVSIQAFTI